MEYKLVRKDSIKLIGASRLFRYISAKKDIPEFRQQYYSSGNRKVSGTYAVNIAENIEGCEFEYLIADNYDPDLAVPEGCVTRVIPAFTWAVFPCRGAMPKALQRVNERVYFEWLPACGDYEIAAGYSIEVYEDPARFEEGTSDKDYYAEMWIPVRKK